MKYGYWLPVFGGWLRNVDDERMETSWDYSRRLAQRSEEIGFDLTLIAELSLNDIKDADAPTLDAWSTAAALAAVTKRLELMVAVRPTFTIPHCSRNRLRTSTRLPVRVASRLTSSPPGGRTRRRNAGCISRRTTIVTLAPPSGSP